MKIKYLAVYALLFIFTSIGWAQGKLLIDLF
jgi:hypothetical protein